MQINVNRILVGKHFTWIASSHNLSCLRDVQIVPKYSSINKETSINIPGSVIVEGHPLG